MPKPTELACNYNYYIYSYFIYINPTQVGLSWKKDMAKMHKLQKSAEIMNQDLQK